MQPTQNYGVLYGKRLGWYIVAGLCVIPIIRWLMLAPLSVRFGSFADVLANLGRIAGIIGVILYAINFVLTTRLRVLENLFGGLNRVYIAHHAIGGLALIAILFHPTFIVMSLVLFSFAEAFNLLMPHMAPSLSWPLDEVSAQIIALNAGTLSFLGTVVLLVLTFFIRMRYKLWLLTHKFLGPAFLLVSVHISLVSSDTSVDPFLRYYLLFFVAIGFAAFVYKTLIGSIFIRRFSYKVAFVRRAEDSVIELGLATQSQRIDFEAGQFVFVRFPNAAQLGIAREWHPFSISSAPQDAILRLSIKALGDFTQSLQAVQEGMDVELEGAYGRFSYRFATAPQQVWIAGGIGIAPFLSMLRSLPANGPQVDVYYVATSQGNMLNLDELAAITKAHKGQIRLFVHPTDKLGWVTGEAVATQTGSLQGKELFLCGPSDMMKTLTRDFVGMGVPLAMIHSEEFTLS